MKPPGTPGTSHATPDPSGVPPRNLPSNAPPNSPPTSPPTSLWIPPFELFRRTVEDLCRSTTPAGHEASLSPLLPDPPEARAGRAAGARSTCERTGNVWYRIPGPGDGVLWTSHLDTVGDEPEPVRFRRHGDVLASDGSTILGADDKVGVAIMSMMIRAAVPGTYAFFTREEIGRLGSIAAADEIADGVRNAPRAVISLDRRGQDSLVTHQQSVRCCSAAWASETCRRIASHSGGRVRLVPDPTGVSTDSLSFIDHVSECTNLSVGYLHQHSCDELVDLRFAHELCLALISLGRSEGVPGA